MNRDPKIYGADAHRFNPSRHLDSEGKIKPAIADTTEESKGKSFLHILLLGGNEFTDRGFSVIRVRSSHLSRKVGSLILCGGAIFTFFARHIANNSLFIDIATILWALTIEPARNDDGEYIMPDIEGYINTGVVTV
jgi:hypothetical protein